MRTGKLGRSIVRQPAAKRVKMYPALDIPQEENGRFYLDRKVMRRRSRGAFGR